MAVSPATLTKLVDKLYSPTGTIGYLLLLSSRRNIDLAITVTLSTSTLVAERPHGLVTGSQVKLAASGSYPGGIGNGWYFAIVTSLTKLKLAETLDAARAGTALMFETAGAGDLTLTERPIGQDDSIEVLVNKELRMNEGYARLPVSNLGQATFNNASARKQDAVLSFTNSSSAPLSYRATVLALGADANIGSTAGIYTRLLDIAASDTIVPPYETRNFRLILGLDL